MAEFSYNGWPASRTKERLPGGLVQLVVAGESFAPGVRGGDVATVLGYVAEQLNARVEPIYKPGWHDADDWGWNYRTNRNANNLSCHASGTAIDYNATRHPNGRRGTYSTAQLAEIRRILAEVGGAVRWGGDFTGTKDEMHFEIRVSPAALAPIAARIRNAHTLKNSAPEDGFLAALSDDQQREIYNILHNGYGVQIPFLTEAELDGDPTGPEYSSDSIRQVRTRLRRAEGFIRAQGKMLEAQDAKLDQILAAVTKGGS